VSRKLIVNADDLGQSPGVNRGIARAVDDGIVTSASLMVRWPAAEAAARWASTRPAVGIGLHLDLGEWAYRRDTWVPVYEVVDTGESDAVDAELSRQLGMFLRLVGRPPTHLDSHQHAHRSDPLRTMLLSAGARLGVPVRELNEEISYCGSFYGQSGRGDPYPEGITFDSLLGILDDLPAGTTELGCHPGDDDLDDLDSMYCAERAVERSVLCDPRLPAALARLGIELGSFG
jgi:predicted glycoside hydrolase/deacetylase ChbG (UPF0249 family)